MFYPTPKLRARSSRVSLTLSAVALFAISFFGCTEGVDPSTAVHSGHARVPIAAYYAGPSGSASADVNRIRITVTAHPGGQNLSTQIFPVDPNAPEWNLPVEFPLATPVDVLVLAELINVTNGIETVEYSGQLGPFRVTPGPTNSTPPGPMPVFRGPPENLNVVAVRVGGVAPVIEGGSIQLSATVEGVSNAQVFWTSLDPTLATVTATGLVQTLLPGVARIVATAGPRSDQASITIGRRMARVELSPSSRTATSIGETADFSARVLDPRNAEFSGVPLSWAVADPNIAEHLGNGRFRAKARGRTAITATVEGNTALRATGEFIVDQRLARVEVTPASRTIDAPGLTAAFSAVGKDAAGNAMDGVTFTWSVANSQVATVDQTGLATGRAVGTTDVRAEASGVSATARLEVRQLAARVDVTPAEYTFTAINERTRFSATVRDASNNIIPGKTVTWRSVTASIVSVDELTGEANANSRGATSIVATVDGVSGSARVNVVPTATRITFNTQAIALTGPGQSFQLQATVRDANNFPVPGKTVTFYSQTPAVATATSGGLVTGVAPGNGLIAATVDGFVATVPVSVGVVPGGTGPGGDLIVFNDINIFGSSGTSGLTFAGNLAAFSGTGPRASGNTVWLQCGRNPAFTTNWCNYDGYPRTALNARGFTVVEKNDPVGSILSVPAEVKMIFFFMPTGLFSSAELAVLRTFVEQGGRIVYLGEHSQGFEATYPPENQLLEMMGTTTRMSPDDNDIGCLFGPGILRSHPVLNDVTNISFACVAAFRTIDPDDFTLVSHGTHPAIVLVRLQTPTAPDVQESARKVATRINTANQRAADAWFRDLKGQGQDPTRGSGKKRMPNP